MVRKFSSEFKQQSIKYTLLNTYFFISELVYHLGVGKLILDI